MKTKIRRAVEQTAFAEGARRVEWVDGHKHYIVKFHMPDGHVASMAVSKGTRDDEYKLKGWTRQYIRNPARQFFRS